MNIQFKGNKVVITGKITQPFSKAKLLAANPIDRMSNRVVSFRLTILFNVSLNRDTFPLNFACV